jgi:hypothetical protein
MYQDAVKVPIGNWANGRLKNLSEIDKVRDNAKNGSGFGKNISNWVGKETVYPTNVVHLSTECNNKNHSAAFPDALPEWFIKLFTLENDVVLDPFAGSGTTLKIAQKMYRNSIGIEILPEYIELIKSNIKEKLEKVTKKKVIVVNGCCFGKKKNSNPEKDGYYKMCGQEFWCLISDDDELYIKIIEPIGHKAKQRNEDFDIAYATLINRFTVEFAKKFCNKGIIDWGKLLEFNSGRKTKK